MNKVGFHEYMDLVGSKINAAKSDLMRNGIRNERGFMETATRIKQGAENLYFSLGNQIFEPVNAMFEAFSERPGLDDVSNVAGVDIVDINIEATQQSVMSYLSAERAMRKNIDTAWYQTLVAINNAGGMLKGNTVYSPFTPFPTNINLGAVVTTKTATPAGTAGNATIQMDAVPVVKKNVTIVATLAGEVVATGTDLKGDGVIYWDKGNICDSATVNYDTGLITITNLCANSVADLVTATANIDRTSQADGGSTLKVKPTTEHVTLISKPNRIIMENSFEDNAYMNKQAYDLSTVGVNLDYGRRAINQLLKTFVGYLDLTSVGATANAMMAQEAATTLDYTNYIMASSDLGTKNDKVNQKILELNTKLQKRSGKGPTCYLVDTEGGNILGGNTAYFRANSRFDSDLDGMIGTYRGLPVVRHHALDGILNTGNELYGFIGAVHKSPDGQVAPTMYGEYLPPYSIMPALNYDNPAQYSQALLSQSTTQTLVPELCAYMKVLVGTND